MRTSAIPGATPDLLHVEQIEAGPQAAGEREAQRRDVAGQAGREVPSGGVLASTPDPTREPTKVALPVDDHRDERRQPQDRRGAGRPERGPDDPFVLAASPHTEDPHGHRGQPDRDVRDVRLGDEGRDQWDERYRPTRSVPCIPGRDDQQHEREDRNSRVPFVAELVREQTELHEEQPHRPDSEDGATVSPQDQHECDEARGVDQQYTDLYPRRLSAEEAVRQREEIEQERSGMVPAESRPRAGQRGRR
jgi:hypothetical protein